MARMTFPLLIFIALVTCVATYNTINMIRSRDSWSMDEAGGRIDGGSREFAFDPLIRLPGESKQGGSASNKRLFHVAVTANESPYNRWQCRIMYYWYKKFREAPGSEMGGFTRILHSGKPDNVMEEIPTFVVDPLPAGEDRGYVVLNRPWAFVQWLRQANISEDYILMAEPDHLFIRPLPNLATEDMPAAYKFFYITPSENEKVLRKFFPEDKGPISNIDPIGNSPVIISKSQLEKIAPTWSDVSIKMKDDPEADKAFGWVLEMYGYATASALHGVKHSLVGDFMLQPPWDTHLGEKYIIHYTYGCDYNMQSRLAAGRGMNEFMKGQNNEEDSVDLDYVVNTSTSDCVYHGDVVTMNFWNANAIVPHEEGKLTYGKIGEWRFDKRAYSNGAPPRNLPLPPPGVPEAVRTLVRMVNEATDNIPGWKEGE